VPRALRRWLGIQRYGYQSVSLDDAGSLRPVILVFRPDCVFHLASALHSAPERELAATNIAGTASLLRALEGTGTRLVLGSSASVYGSPGRLPIDEAHPCAPVNAYGTTKLAAEQLAARHGAGVVIARVFNVVGPGQSEDHVCGRLASRQRGPESDRCSPWDRSSQRATSSTCAT
jgi:nucleoside-diphosphate-sugar epimerase